MHVVAISCVKNEIDIVEAFVRHTLARVDRLVVLDNGSSDGTRQIMQQLAEEGLPLEIVDDPSPGHYQWRRMTDLMRRSTSDDWIVPLDADEFLGGADIRELLQSQADGDRPFALPWKTYVPDPSDEAGELNPVRRIVHRLKHEARPCAKVAIPTMLARQPGVALDQGSHLLLRDGVEIPAVMSGQGFLAHFPGRSPDQFAVKVAVKHVQYLAMTQRHPLWGFHYRPSVGLLRRGRREFDAAFHQTLIRYNLRDDEPFEPELVLDTFAYAGGELRYTPVESDTRLVPTLLECAEDLARRHAELVTRRQEDEAAAELLADAIRERDAEIEALRRSWTWRVGRAVLGPARWAKRWLARR